MQENLTTQINIKQYTETCPTCLQPARAESVDYDINGNDIFYFCVNPKCMNFDFTWLREKRERLERQARAAKPFRRYQARIYKARWAGRLAV